MSELVWAYCVVPAPATGPPKLVGVDPWFDVERVEEGPLALLVSRVPEDEFSSDALQKNLNDFAWLERVARAHESVLDQVLAETAMVPLRLCTLYEAEAGARKMLTDERQSLVEALERVSGCEEWSLKLLLDPELLQAAAREADPELAAMDAEADAASEAAAYLVRRRQERRLREVSDRLVVDAAYDLEALLESAQIEIATLPPQNRELSHHRGEMLLNAACLVDEAGVERLRLVAADFEARYGPLGAAVELSGPWPPYNFVGPKAGAAAA
jgi:Gas vesicle synthesis protein GvpL/GvpF